MSQQFAANQTSMSEAQIKQLIKDLANTFSHPIRSPILHTPDEYGLEYKNVSFPSMDGVPLEAWFMPANSDKLVIANHPLWFNRYGFPAHLEPWKQIGAAGGNDFEVNFMPDYRHLHDAGYNVLAYDMRNFTAVPRMAGSAAMVSSSPATSSVPSSTSKGARTSGT